MAKGMANRGLTCKLLSLAGTMAVIAGCVSAASAGRQPESSVTNTTLLTAPMVKAGGVTSEVTRGYYLQPTIHGDTIVFISEGDLWKVPVTGGVATRLTTHLTDEAHPAISPDGKTVAFVAAYEGPAEVYTMPIEGGLPTRRTWGLARTGFIGWTPDGKLMHSTRQFATLPSSQIVTTDLKTGDAKIVPLYEADQGAYSDDGKTLFFTRMPFQGSHTKRYKGGFIQQLWKFSEGDAEATGLTTDYAGTSKEAMVWQGRVYFVTDRDGVMNIWSMNPSGKDLKQHTRHTDFDVIAPDLRGGRIVYSHAGDLRVLDIATGKDSAVDARLSSDFDQLRERWVKNPAGAVSYTGVSPNGDRVVLTARGRVYVAPAKASQGRFVEVAGDPGVRFRNAVFSADGKSIIALSDSSGEVEFWSLPANGVGERKRITTDGTILRWEGEPSPDGKLLAHSDKDNRLFITEIATGKTTLVSQNAVERIEEYSWSPDSKWLVFTDQAENLCRRVRLYSLESGKITDVTSDRFESGPGRFSPDGKWLYVLSDRNIRSTVGSPWGPLAPMPFFDNRTKVYHIPLKAGTRSPWQPKDELADIKKDEPKKDEPKKDDVAKADEKKDDAPKGDDKKVEAKKDETKKDDKKTVTVEIDLEGIQQRLIEVPIKPGNYSRLFVTENAIYFAETQAGLERGEPGPLAIKAVSVGNDKVEVKTVASGVRGFEISRDNKKVLVHRGDSLYIVDAAPAPADLEKGEVSLAAMSMSYIPMVEYRQLYADAWRLLRDYFYAKNMHGVDWPAMRKKYEPLVERCRNRQELNEVFAQLTGELSTLHHFVRGGDFREGQQDIGIASLGCEWERDAAAGGWRITRVYRHDPDEPSTAGPLSRPGIEVKVGDVVTAINGQKTLDAAHPSMLLRNKVGQQVLLSVRKAAAAAAGEAAEKDVIVRPFSQGELANLRYTDWEYGARLTVDKDSDNRIGYVHLRAMGGPNIAEWTKGFFPVFNREGLIIDVRRNNGGNIDSWILGALMRKAWMYWNSRVMQGPTWNMQYAFRGHVVVICDAFTASDGEAFSEGFKRLGLGKVIGMRTWGGEIWLSSSNDLADGGLASAGEYGVFGPEGIWLVEGHGVDPDIVVDNGPHAMFKGEDAQLKAAIAHLKKLMAEKPVPPVKAPPFPDKSVKQGPGANAPAGK